MGKKKNVTRENTMQMRVNDSEFNIIEGKASSLGLTTSNYMRLVCLNANVEVLFNAPTENLNS